MSNLNTVDDLPNITSNFTDEEYHHRETSYERIFLEVFTVVGLLSVVANSLLIFVIVKYKKMREDPTNVIFLQMNILQAFCLLATPLTLRILMEFFDVSPVHTIVFCASYQVESTIMVAITWYLFLLICDWYLKLYYKNVYVKFCRVYKFFIAAFYVLTMFVCSITVQICFKSAMYGFVYMILAAGLCFLVLFLIIINIIHLVRRRRITSDCKGNIGLAIANIWFGLWCPTLIFVLLTILGNIAAPVLLIFVFSLGFSSPVFNLIYLYYYDDRYNIFLRKVFTCKCNEYSNESLETPVSYNDVNGVQIPDN
ncbi:hypothetical protein Zmor_025167 [Zophobas morio]|uniref:G-protein coupled receptors family 1 profile domain-containing protein n=1 Tax=Zophobas morio TaxID=2755281 RepID=A0AA38HTE5_9CUCU|nr:hypothetical protein Zmor_025167 [Zophobas morio]